MMISNPPISPRLYEILQSLNGTGYNPVNPFELVEATKSKVFDFSYGLNPSINKGELESNILRHFLMRRLGLETYAYWKMRLIDKMCEITPKYNPLFESLNILKLSNGKIIKSEDIYGSANVTSYNSSNATTYDSSNEIIHDTKDETNGSVDSRISDTPQGSIESVQDASYISNYGLDTTNNSIERTGSDTTNHKGVDTVAHSGVDTTNHSGTDKHNTIEELSSAELLEAISKYNSEIQSIYTMIYKDLDELFLLFM